MLATIVKDHPCPPKHFHPCGPLLKPLISIIIKMKEHLNLTSMELEHKKEPMAFFTHASS
jgi:hypothetical protein